MISTASGFLLQTVSLFLGRFALSGTSSNADNQPAEHERPDLAAPLVAPMQTDTIAALMQDYERTGVLCGRRCEKLGVRFSH